MKGVRSLALVILPGLLAVAMVFATVWRWETKVTGAAMLKTDRWTGQTWRVTEFEMPVFAGKYAVLREPGLTDAEKLEANRGAIPAAWRTRRVATYAGEGALAGLVLITLLAGTWYALAGKVAPRA